MPGNDEDQESYRAEIYGIVCIMTFTDLLSKFYNIRNGGITIACDNIEAGKNTMQRDTKPSPKTKHFDLLWLAWEIRQKSTIQWTYHHVRGHQEKKKRTRLDKWEIKNIRMDNLAKRFLKHLSKHPPRSSPTTSYEGQWEVHCGECKITSNVKKTVTHHIHGRALRHHYVRTGKLAVQAINLINWKASEKANKNLSDADSIWLTKFVSKSTATGKMMKRCNQWNHSKCPRCETPDEDTLHVIMCPDDEARSNLYDNICAVDTWIEKYKTHPAIRSIITNTLLQFNTTTFNDTAEFMLFEDDSNTANLIRLAAQEQDIIGWQNIFEGRISKTWEVIQDEYYSSIKEANKTGLTWSTWFIKKIYAVSKSQWNNRNEILHNQTQNKISRKEKEQLQAEVEKEFKLGDDEILVTDIGIFLLTEDEINLLPADEQKAWLKSVYIARKRSNPNYNPPRPLRRYDG